MNVDELAATLRDRLQELSPELGLTSPFEVAYIPNAGGLRAANFSVSDGARPYHLKLVKSAVHRDSLRRWERVSDLVAARYRAPRMLRWIDIPDCEWSGGVFEHLRGVPPTRAVPPRFLDLIVPLIEAMHSDEELAERLGGEAPTMREVFVDYHIGICTRDLDDLTEDEAFPPFVDDALRDWMRSEVVRLHERACSSAAFDDVAKQVMHGDLWFGNFLIEGDSWHLIDWDEVKLGDPAHDLALLLFTAIDDGEPAGRWIKGRDDAFMERFSLGMQGILLDCVIDPLADWAEAKYVPSVTEATRTHRERFHRWALGRYRARYG